MEACFGKKNHSPKTDTDTRLGKVMSIDNEVVRLKELDLLRAEVSTQSSIDVILQAIIHSYEGFGMKFKGKEVCLSSESMSGIVESMVSPHSMKVGSTSYSKPKGEERKEEAKDDKKFSAISVRKARVKSKAKSRGFVSIARMMDIGQEIVQSI
jgi:hypothetical protein